jgi:H+/Cl- antiporter ClcA
MQAVGKYIILFGIILVIVGLILHFAGNSLNWLGKLPGDIRIEKENHRIYIPITSMILVSIILTIIVNLIRKFLL